MCLQGPWPFCPGRSRHLRLHTAPEQLAHKWGVWSAQMFLASMAHWPTNACAMRLQNRLDTICRTDFAYVYHEMSMRMWQWLEA